MGRNNKRKSSNKRSKKNNKKANNIKVNNTKKNNPNGNGLKVHKRDENTIKEDKGFKFDLSKIKGTVVKIKDRTTKKGLAAIAAGALVMFTIPVMMLSQKEKKEDQSISLLAKMDNETVGKIVKASQGSEVGGFLIPQWNIEKAKNAFSDGDIENGNMYLGAAMESELIDEEIANEIILIYFTNGQALKSMEVGEELIKEYKNSIKLSKTMIMVYLFNGVKDKAVSLINELRDSMDLNFSSLEPINEYKDITDGERAQKYADLAEMFYLIGQKQATLEYLEKAWNYDRDNYKVYDIISKMGSDNMFETLSNIALREETLQEKAKDNKAIRYNEKMFKLWLAKIYTLDDKTSLEAQFLLEDLEEEFGNLINVKRMKATVMVLNSQVEEGMKYIGDLVQEYPNDFSIRYTASSLYYVTQNFDKALESALKVVELKPNYEDTYGLLLPNIYAALGEEEKVEESFLESIEKNPISVSNINAIAEYYFRNNDYEKSIQYYEIAKVLNPSNAEIRYKAAWGNIALAEKLKAQLNYDEGQEITVQMEESNEDAEGIRLQMIDHYEKALESVLSSIKLTSENPIAKYYRMASIIYMNLGEAEKSYEHIRKAYRLDEDDILTLNNAGVFHFLLNDYQEDFDNDSRVYRGFYNLYKAYEGLNGDSDPGVIDVITRNYEIAEEFRKKFKEADDNAILKLPKGFKLLY